MVEESSNDYLPSYSVDGRRLKPPRLGDAPPEAHSVLSSELEFSVEDSSIHTSDYGSSSIDTSILHYESDMDTAFDTKYDERKNESSSSRSKNESPRNSGGTARNGSSTEESSSDWIDVSDSSSGSEGCHGGPLHLEEARTRTRSAERRTGKPIQLPEMPRRGRIRTFDSGSQSRLRHVDYLSQIDVASLGREQVSREGPIRPMDAQSAFEREVPFEVPVLPHDREKDDISSIGAVSQPPKRIQDLKAKRDPLDLERGIQTIPSLETLQALKEELSSDAWGAPRRSELELFFIALIAISLVILVILLILLLSQG